MKFTVATDHDEAVGDHGDAQQVEDIERTDKRRVGLKELPNKALHAVIRDEEIEPVALHENRAARDRAEIYHDKREHRRGFVELHRMAGNAVAEIDAPR